MKLKLLPSQYKLLSRYCEDLSKAVALYNVAGFFLPSILPNAIRPSLGQFLGSIVAALTLLTAAGILIKGAKNV